MQQKQPKDSVDIICEESSMILNRNDLKKDNIFSKSLDDQTHVDSKPAGKAEHASLNQCQLIAANRPKLMLWVPPAGGGDKVSQ